jgi:hypothetical protein
MGWPNPGDPYGAPNVHDIELTLGSSGTFNIYELFATINAVQYPNGIIGASGNVIYATITCSGYFGSASGSTGVAINNVLIDNVAAAGGGAPIVHEFPLKNINGMREEILKAVSQAGAVKVDYTSEAPYGWGLDAVGGAATDSNWKNAYALGNQEGLAVKTYQSDLFNSFIDQEWIEGATGVGEVSAVVVQQNQAGTDDVIYMDSLNLQQKVYNMLNRIAVSGGSYDDWLDAVYTHERAKGVESPVYHGSLIKTLAFEEVVSNSDVEMADGNQQPLGTLAGRGKLTGKHKGGKMKIKCAEPSVILGIVSITPLVDYSQGNKWSVDLKTMNDFYKPEMGAIGYQDLVTGQMHWAGDTISNTGDVKHESAGKQPAWLNYMTNINVCKGNFALKENSMFMTLNRRYEQSVTGIRDITTYIDPSKFNHIFAETSVDAQNFWVQIGADVKARRKMSAKVIPNL